MRLNPSVRLCFFLAFALLLVLLTGCVQVGPKFSEPVQPPQGKATVYFYRQASLLGASSNPGIAVNGQQALNRMPAWSWWFMPVEPGNYVLEPTLFGLFKKTTAELKNVRSGETYFVRLDVQVGEVGLQVVPAEQALAEIVKCHQIVEKEVAGAGSDGTDISRNRQGTETGKLSAREKADHRSGSQAASALLFVKSSPENATIRILNIKPKFAQGMRLDPGKYHVETSARGHETDRRWISITAGEEKTLSVSLSRSEASMPDETLSQASRSQQVYVNTLPTAATIRILNIKPKFTQGMRLTPGKYHVEVSADGYITSRQWVTVRAGDDITVDIYLAPVVVETSKPIRFADPEMERCARLLRSDNALNKRDAAKIIIRRYSNESDLLDLVEAELLAGFNQNINDRHHVDAMAWLCKALGNSGDQKYRATLAKVSEEAINRKLRGYAQNAL